RARDGVVGAQSFPGKYDGLVIGAPAIYSGRVTPSEQWARSARRVAGRGPIGLEKLNAATKAAIAACDAKDGVEDGIIDDPRKCTYDPAALVCKGGGDTATCLTAQEASAIRKIWDGPTSTSGQRLWFGLERGTPLGFLAG